MSDQLQERIDELERQLVEALNDIVGLRCKLSVSNNVSNKLDAELAELKSKLADAQAEIARRKKELEEASALVCIANDYLPDHWDMDCVPLHKIKEFAEKYEQSAPKQCLGEDPLCPCQDGDMCHYEGENPMPTAEECGNSSYHE